MKATVVLHHDSSRIQQWCSAFKKTFLLGKGVSLYWKLKLSNKTRCNSHIQHRLPEKKKNLHKTPNRNHDKSRSFLLTPAFLAVCGSLCYSNRLPPYTQGGDRQSSWPILANQLMPGMVGYFVKGNLKKIKGTVGNVFWKNTQWGQGSTITQTLHNLNIFRLILCILISLRLTS